MGLVSVRRGAARMTDQMLTLRAITLIAPAVGVLMVAVVRAMFTGEGK
jgi:hypothetical protein